MAQVLAPETPRFKQDRVKRNKILTVGEICKEQLKDKKKPDQKIIRRQSYQQLVTEMMWEEIRNGRVQICSLGTPDFLFSVSTSFHLNYLTVYQTDFLSIHIFMPVPCYSSAKNATALYFYQSSVAPDFNHHSLFLQLTLTERILC